MDYEFCGRCQSQEVIYYHVFVRVAQNHAKAKKWFGINKAKVCKLYPKPNLSC
jgi:hypothetical protein